MGLAVLNGPGELRWIQTQQCLERRPIESRRRKGSGANPKQIRSRVPKAVGWRLPATPAVKLVPNVLLCFPLDPLSEAEGGGVSFSGQPRTSRHTAQACAPGRSLRCCKHSSLASPLKRTLLSLQMDAYNRIIINKSLAQYRWHWMAAAFWGTG